MRTKNLLLTLATLSVFTITQLKSYSQTPGVGIGTTSPHTSALLDLTSNQQGFLPPRMTIAERNSITNPAKGLVVFTNDDSSFHFFDGTWRKLMTDREAWGMNGNAANPLAFIGTTNAMDLYFKVNNQSRVVLNQKGRLALYGNQDNLLIGMASGEALTTGHLNHFVGSFAGSSTTTGSYNWCSGYAAGANLTTGSRNYLSGNWAGATLDTGSYNHFAGIHAGFANVGGSFNHFDGYGAGSNNVGSISGGVEYGSYNYFSGFNAGLSNLSGGRNTLVGNFANVTRDSLFNAGAIGFDARVAQSNSFVIGGTGVRKVNVGIGTQAPQKTLDVQSGATHSDVAIFRSTGGFGQIFVTQGTNITDLGADGGGGYVGTNDGETENFRIRTGATTRMYFQHSTGNVGVGTFSPAEKLHVAGNLVVDGSINNESLQTPVFQPGWSNYGGAFGNASYYKDKENRVHLDGLAQTSSIPVNSVIFNLPPGYRPPHLLIFMVLNNTNMTRIDIYPDGNVRVPVGVPGWFNLTGISFRSI
jgi:hypothetical protein